MIYSYMTLPDNTEITHTELKSDGSVIVYAEALIMPQRFKKGAP